MIKPIKNSCGTWSLVNCCDSGFVSSCNLPLASGLDEGAAKRAAWAINLILQGESGKEEDQVKEESMKEFQDRVTKAGAFQFGADLCRTFLVIDGEDAYLEVRICEGVRHVFRMKTKSWNMTILKPGEHLK